MARRNVILGAVGLALAAAAAIAADRAVEARQRAAERAFDITPANAPAPEVDLTAGDGGTFRLSDHRGEVVFLNFWATWCPPCREEMPSMMQLGRDLQERYPGKFRMVAVSVDEGWDPVRQFFGGRVPRGFTVALDADQRTTRAYYCVARGGCPDSYKFPESYVVDKSGRLVAFVVGPRDWSDPAARRFLVRLIER